MQPTIHLEGKTGFLPRPHPALCSKCIVGCIFNSVGLIITRESPCTICNKLYFLNFNLLSNCISIIIIYLHSNT
jgi:hypothetical protein